MTNQTPTTFRFSMTYCSQCGNNMGPGNEGFSSCHQHWLAHGLIDAEGNPINPERKLQKLQKLQKL